jgi:polyribonucleotide nucleotidyltransferase
VVNVGDQVKVKVIGFDERGKIKLSMRVVDQATGTDITAQVGERPARGDRPERGDRPDRGGDRGDRGFDRPRRERPAFQEGTDQPPIGE